MSFLQLQQCILQLITQCFGALCIFFHVEATEFAGFTKTYNTWYIQRTTAHTAFMTTAIHLCGYLNAWILAAYI